MEWGPPEEVAAETFKAFMCETIRQDIARVVTYIQTESSKRAETESSYYQCG